MNVKYKQRWFSHQCKQPWFSHRKITRDRSVSPKSQIYWPISMIETVCWNRGAFHQMQIQERQEWGWVLGKGKTSVK